MSSSLLEVWNAAASSPFYPTVGKNSQFFVGFTLLIAGMLPHLHSWCISLTRTRSPLRWVV